MAGIDLDGDVRRVDPDRWLASRFITDPAARADVVALYAFDHELAHAGHVTSSDLAAEIRLAWWREALDDIQAGRAPRRHPVAEALARVVSARALPPEPFEAMVAARIDSLGKGRLELAEAQAWATGAQGALARLAARVLDPAADEAMARPAGVAWGLVLLRRSGRSGGDQFDLGLRAMLAGAREAARHLPAAAFPAALPATLARADLGSKSPGELEKRARLSWAALTGRL
ncbi:MAG TPA: squalene/phytoene synthase family protein [Caulobacteraceae bacterium]